ncbi:hypothetical protein DPMN_062675 [Dreissena polymorpha]|uniref:Uncharacterized protein n=1 Tax=Dreissena polymorpha TaxID=45954 RepID=A0A9D4C951_DREPO|nr:hypothetical protein DPMN_062675 [Dreissena polymorpha]
MTTQAADREPTIKDILDSNKGIMASILALNERLNKIETKLGNIDRLDKKVSEFEKELKKVCIALEERAKRTDERARTLEDNVELVDMGSALLSSRVADLEKQREELREDVVYLLSQSMRNNFVFTNIPEDNASGNETSEESEKKLRQHLETALKLTKETVGSIKLERVHRTPGHPTPGKFAIW